MTTLRTAAQQALEALETVWPIIEGEKFKHECSYGGNFSKSKTDRARKACVESLAAIAALRAALAQQDEPCPNCASLEAQNDELDRKLAEMERAHGIIESEIKVDSHQTLDDAMQQPRAMAQAYERGYNAGVAARDAEHQQTLALQQRSYEREIQLDVEAERERCLRLIDEHVRAVDAEDVVRAIKEGKE